MGSVAAYSCDCANLKTLDDTKLRMKIKSTSDCKATFDFTFNTAPTATEICTVWIQKETSFTGSKKLFAGQFKVAAASGTIAKADVKF